MDDPRPQENEFQPFILPEDSTVLVQLSNQV